MTLRANTQSRLYLAVISVACTLMSSLAGAQEISPVEDSPIRSYFLIDQFEYSTNRYTNGNKSDDAIRINTSTWIGGDYNRIWLYTEATKPDNGKIENLDVQLLYGALISPFWDLQMGLRYSKPLSDAPSHQYVVLGVQGLAPYRFGVQAAAYISEYGDLSARAEIEYELLLTQRWILQPRFATNIAFQKVEEQGVGRGLNDLELGLRLRYEIAREFAPYIGVSWHNLYGEAAQFVRDRGERVAGLNLLAGVRVWF